MSFLEEIIEHSSLFQEERVKAEAKGLQKGLQNGLQNGMAAGKAEEARNLLRMALSRKYPGMETMQQIDRIVDVRTLESLLLDRVLGGDARAVVERAILTAAAGEDR